MGRVLDGNPKVAAKTAGRRPAAQTGVVASAGLPASRHKEGMPGNYPFTNRSCSQQEFTPWDADPDDKLGWHSVYEQVERRKLGR